MYLIPVWIEACLQRKAREIDFELHTSSDSAWSYFTGKSDFSTLASFSKWKDRAKETLDQMHTKPIISRIYPLSQAELVTVAATNSES